MSTPKKRLAVVGAGLIGRRHIRTIAASEAAELAAIADPTAESRALAAELGVPCFDELAELLTTVRPDGAIVATPNHLHVAQGLVCVQARCPVLIEKPIAVSALDAEQLLRAARAAEVPLLVGHHRRHNPLIQRAKQLIDERRLGVIRTVQASCWLYKPDDYFQQSPWRMAKGAGPVSVNMIHDVDLLRYLIGEVRSVHAMASPSLRGHDNEDLAVAVLRFSGGAIGSLSVADAVVAPWSWELSARENAAYSATDQSCYQIGGSHGALSLPDLRLWRYEGERSWWAPISASHYPVERSDPLLNQIEHFCRVIDGAQPPLVSGEEGTATLRVIEAIQRSAASGQSVEL